MSFLVIATVVNAQIFAQLVSRAQRRRVNIDKSAEKPGTADYRIESDGYTTCPYSRSLLRTLLISAQRVAEAQVYI